ncbi:MAG TPA: hypothetical protein VFV19_19230 [Candidatus Polarisedimenticolaceae bacterium]|nr:hypothetical protein [Candidatus Polarisedimenticolaceae bacterium]
MEKQAKKKAARPGTTRRSGSSASKKKAKHLKRVLKEAAAMLKGVSKQLESNKSGDSLGGPMRWVGGDCPPPIKD